MTEAPDAVCLSSAMHSVIPVDEVGNPLMNMITWADNRSTDIARRLRQAPSGETIYTQTGTPIHAMSPLTKIIWIRENDPGLFQRVHKYISIKEFIWFRLFKSFEIDYSIASATGMFDIRKLQWNETALDLCGINTLQLSAPVNTNHTRRGTDPVLGQQLGVSNETAFVIGASDGCLANLGSFATEPGVAALTIGTSGAIRVAGTEPVCDYQYMPFNYRLDEKTFISGGPVNNGGVALKWYAENFLNRSLASPEDYHDLLGSAAAIPAGSEGLIFLPYLQGERAPIWNSDARGAFFGITMHHRQAHFTRAVLEGISLALYHIGRTLENNGLPIRHINVSGGFVRSLHWLQMLADIFGKEIHLIHSDDASAIGATFIGMKALGIIDEYRRLNPGESKTFYPDTVNHTMYKEHVFPRYEQLYKAMASGGLM
jgi:gluconokinase